jgi:hypothetical protein
MGGVTWSPDGTRLLWGGRDGWYMAQTPDYDVVTRINQYHDYLWLIYTSTLWLP